MGSVCLRERIREREREKELIGREREREKRRKNMNERKNRQDMYISQQQKKRKNKEKKYINIDTKYALIRRVDLERFEFFARINLRQFRSESRHQERLELMSSMRKNRGKTFR